MSPPPYTCEDRDHLLADLNPAQREAVTPRGGAAPRGGRGRDREDPGPHPPRRLAGGRRAPRPRGPGDHLHEQGRGRPEGAPRAPDPGPARSGPARSTPSPPGCSAGTGTRSGSPATSRSSTGTTSARIVRDLLQDRGLDGDGGRPAAVVTWISHRKNGGAGRGARRLPRAGAGRALPGPRGGLRRAPAGREPPRLRRPPPRGARASSGTCDEVGDALPAALRATCWWTSTRTRTASRPTCSAPSSARRAT